RLSLLPALPRGGRVGRQALDGRDPLRAAPWRPPALHRDRTGRARPVGPAADRAHEGAPGARDRRAGRERLHAGEGVLRADREGPPARSRPGRVEGLGGPLVGLTSTDGPPVAAARSTSLAAPWLTDLRRPTTSTPSSRRTGSASSDCGSP